MAIELCVLCGEPIGDGNYCPSCGGMRPPPEKTEDPLIGTVVADRYEILALVSAGGMGRVEVALRADGEDPDVCVIKRLHGALHDEEQEARFRNAPRFRGCRKNSFRCVRYR